MRKTPRERTPLAIRLLRWVCPDSLIEGIEGDILEQFEADQLMYSHRRSQWRRWIHVLRFVRPGIVFRNKFKTRIINNGMLQSYLKIAFRNAQRNKLFTIVNVTGLTLGLCVSFLLFVHVRQEMNYETHVPDRELVYRVSTNVWAKMPPLLSEKMKDQFAGIAAIGRMNFRQPPIIQRGEALALPQFVYAVDPAIVDVFGFTFVKGNPRTALVNPATAVISRSMSEKLFKDGEDPLGQVISLDGYQDFTITGVMEDVPRNTHLKVDCMLSIAGTGIENNTSLGWRGVAVYARFNSADAARMVNEQLRGFQYKFYEGDRTREDIDRQGEYFEMEPITAIHLQSHKEKEAEANSDIMYVIVFSVFAVLILLIACINFVNLFSAQAVGRIREIGIRKAIGAVKSQLTIQFLGEAFAIVLFSSMLALALTYTILPWYNRITGADLTVLSMLSGDHMLIFASLALITALCAGGYPAWVIAEHDIHDSVKGHALTSSAFTRKLLVGLQFTFSGFLLMATAIVYAQMNFIDNRYLGFNKEEVLAVKLYGRQYVAATKGDALRSELLRSNLVHEVGLAERIAGERLGFEGIALVDRPESESLDARRLRADEGFLPAMQIRLVSGTNFSPGDTITQFIINEAAARQLNAGDPVGLMVRSIDNNSPAGRIVGVVEDFNYASLHSAIDPMAIEFSKRDIEYMLVRMSGSEKQEAMQHVESTLRRFAPGTALLGSFVDQRLENLYTFDVSLLKVTQYFSIITIVIATLGLFALAAHEARTRIREIGIRKVLGASVRQILILVGRSFMMLIVMSLLIAGPAAWYAGNRWLSTFSYKVDLGFWMFAVPAAFVLVVGLLTVIGQSVRAARTNPAQTLKHE